MAGKYSAKDVAVAYQISLTAAENRLSRAYKFGWLSRRKYEGAYWYSLSQKAWDFYYTYGSFIEGNPWYRWGAMKKPLYYPNIVPWNP